MLQFFLNLARELYSKFHIQSHSHWICKKDFSIQNEDPGGPLVIFPWEILLNQDAVPTNNFLSWLPQLGRDKNYYYTSGEYEEEEKEEKEGTHF
jgi:hypothetical protein